MATPGPSAGASSSRSSSSTPTRPSQLKPIRPQSNKYTRFQQDQQARNKEPNDIDDYEDEDEFSDEGRVRDFDMYGNESYTAMNTRREAVYVLDNPEVLMMHAQARNDSIPATRHYFRQLLSGHQPTPAEEEISKSARIEYFEKVAREKARQRLSQSRLNSNMSSSKGKSSEGRKSPGARRSLDPDSASE